jgi:hypothetical protein
MSLVAISGNASGTGTLTIAAPNTNSNYTLTLPTNTGTLLSTASAGTVLQVVNATYATATSTTSTSFVSTGLTASITPSSASNKVLIMFSNPLSSPAANDATAATVFRGTTSGTNLGASSLGFGVAQGPGGANERSVVAASYLDSPATTSAQTYTVAFLTQSGTGIAQAGNTTATLTLMEIAA